MSGRQGTNSVLVGQPLIYTMMIQLAAMQLSFLMSPGKTVSQITWEREVECFLRLKILSICWKVIIFMH